MKPGLLATMLVACALHALPVTGQQTVDDDYRAGDYEVFAGDGTPVSLEHIVDAMAEVEVVFIGETHDDPTAHHLEFELLRLANERYGIASTDDDAGRPIALSLEFFQRDVQLILDEYLAGLINEDRFLDASRPWPRYETDYRQLVEYAKEENLPVVAANAPARYANRAARLGRESLEELSSAAKATLPPLPYGEASRAYLDQFVQVMMDVQAQERQRCGVPIPESDEAGAAHQPTSAHSHTGSGFDGQVLWDAAMAYSVSEHLVREPNALVLHMVGSFHVARGTGTPEHLVRYRPGSSSLIVVIRPVEDVLTFEAAPSGTWGDFVVQTDASRTLQVLECREAG